MMMMMMMMSIRWSYCYSIVSPSPTAGTTLFSHTSGMTGKTFILILFIHTDFVFYCMINFL